LRAGIYFLTIIVEKSDSLNLVNIMEKFKRRGLDSIIVEVVRKIAAKKVGAKLSIQ
jgi:predicted nucleotide-binding protein (sugar kinase/HSP70/actin superfamily)